MPVITGAMEYPSDILGKMEHMGVDIVSCDALALAKEAGNIKAVNIVLIGVMAKHTNVSKEEWEKAIADTVPEKFLEVNLKAFRLGYDAAE